MHFSTKKIFILLTILTASASFTFACTPITSETNKITATKWLISKSGGYPRYTNQNEYVFIFKNFKPSELCGPDLYYMKKSLFTLLILLTAVIGTLVFLRKKSRARV